MAPVPCNRDPSRRTDRRHPLALLVSLGWEIALTVGLFTAAGWWVSSKTESVIPLLVLSLVGIAVGLWRFFRQVVRL